MWKRNQRTLVNFSPSISGGFLSDLFFMSEWWSKFRQTQHLEYCSHIESYSWHDLFQFLLHLFLFSLCPRVIQEATAPCWAAEHGQDAGLVVPQEEEEPFSPERQRDDTCVKDCLRETERDLTIVLSVGLINVKRMYNICRSHERRMLGNSGCAGVESQITESADQILIAGHSFSVTKEIKHPDKWS